MCNSFPPTSNDEVGVTSVVKTCGCTSDYAPSDAPQARHVSPKLISEYMLHASGTCSCFYVPYHIRHKEDLQRKLQTFWNYILCHDFMVVFNRLTSAKKMQCFLPGYSSFPEISLLFYKMLFIVK